MLQRMQQGLQQREAKPYALGSRGSLWSQPLAEGNRVPAQLQLQRQSSSSSSGAASAGAPSRSGSLLLQAEEVLGELAEGMEEELLLPQRCLGDKACPVIAKHLFRCMGLRSVDLSVCSRQRILTRFAAAQHS